MDYDIKVEIDETAIADKFSSITDEETMLQIHNTLAQMCTPYVPMREGVLSSEGLAGVTSQYVRWPGPYAHYQYIGEVYSPNIPIIENGIIIGWWSPPGKPKHPTGRPINYSTDKHPLATKEWDKAMMADRGDEFKQQVKDIIVARLNNG